MVHCSCITSSVKLKRRKKRDFQTFLHSEFVTKQKFPAVLWYKSTLLPSILHRTHYFLLAEDLRQKIVIEAKVGNLYIPMGKLKMTDVLRFLTFTDSLPWILENLPSPNAKKENQYNFLNPIFFFFNVESEHTWKGKYNLV